jgi:predicted GIY-YIG superfamily endonuclease
LQQTQYQEFFNRLRLKWLSLLLRHGFYMPFYVYELLNSADGQRFYIGMTGKPKQRLHDHIKGDCISTAAFIANLLRCNQKPEMRILHECSSHHEAHALEKSLILQARKSKDRVCNTRRGRVLHPSTRNHGASWREHDRQRVLDMLRSGIPPNTVARQFGRSRGSIRGILRNFSASHIQSGASKNSDLHG